MSPGRRPAPGLAGSSGGRAELQRAAAAVADAYRRAGWVVRACLPRQDVSAGAVTIQVVEARFGVARIGADLQDVDLAHLARYVNVTSADAPVNADALDRAILLIDDLPGVSATGNLVARSGEGQTDLLLNARDEPLLSGSAAIDNTAPRSTGAWEATASVFLNSPLRQGDQLQADLGEVARQPVRPHGIRAALGSAGWRVGVDGSALRYLLAAVTRVADINATPTGAPPLPTPALRLPGQATSAVLAMPAAGSGLLPAAAATVGTVAGAVPGAVPGAATGAVTAAPPVAVPAQMAERAVAGTTPGILVSLVRTPSARQSGEVTVSVPPQIAQDARGFGFALPATLLETAAAQGTAVSATALDGGALPGWIRFEAASGAFAVANPPAGALPLRLRLAIGSQQTSW